MPLISGKSVSSINPVNRANGSCAGVHAVRQALTAQAISQHQNTEQEWGMV